MNVRSLVRRAPETVTPDATCAQAARRMLAAHVGSLIVVEDRKPLGIVTDRDLVVRVVAEGKDPEKVTVREAMSERPIFVSDSCEVAAALELMRDLAVRRLPVVNASQEPIGVVALDDVVLALAGQLSAAADLIRKEL